MRNLEPIPISCWEVPAGPSPELRANPQLKAAYLGA